MIKNQILADLKKVLEKLNLPLVEPVLEHPAQETHGDYATNVAMALFRNQEWKTPFDLAQEIANSYKLLDIEYLDRIETAPPGFINFWLSRDYLTSQIPQILKKGKNYGAVGVGGGKKVQVEFISANPTGPLHMGNIRGGPIGDVLANILEKVGYKVEREFYVNDIGGQVERFGESLLKIAQGEKLENLEYKGDYMGALADEIKSDLDRQFGSDFLSKKEEGWLKEKFTKFGVARMKDKILKDAQDLGIVFDNLFYESRFTYKTKKVPSETEIIIQKLRSKGVAKEKDGALWFAPNDEFLKDRECVLLRSDGSPTYFANDIAYHFDKFKERKYDLVIDIWGANHHGHAPRMKAAMAALGIDPERLKIIFYQWVSLVKEGKRISMSKRKGEFITMREVLDEIGFDAMRFLLLSSSANNHLELDLDLAKQKAAENPVFYVQYAHARICSIFKKAPQIDFQKANFSLLAELAEIKLLKHLTLLPEMVEEIATSFAVHLLPSYAIKLADLFHKFYEECRVISKDKELTAARLELVRATKVTLVNTLSLLGISTPETM